MSDLVFTKVSKKDDIRHVYEFNLGAFSDSPDFNWSLDSIEDELSQGWELYSVSDQDEIIAACFYKIVDDALLTKNTSIKMGFQGSGYSHKIKEYFEKIAREKHLKKIYHYCAIDNFRMYSLNESHNYRRTKRQVEGTDFVIEWVKDIKNKK